MASRKTSTTNRGFTLLEILIVIGLIAIIGSAVLFIDLNSYRGDALRAERSTLVTLLAQARMDSLNNVHQMSHGLALHPADAPNFYVLFEGGSYAASDMATRIVYPEAYHIELDAGSPQEVIFKQLSGDAYIPGTILMRDPERSFSYSIAINSEGGLIW